MVQPSSAIEERRGGSDSVRGTAAKSLLELAAEMSDERVRSFEHLARSERGARAWRRGSGTGIVLGLVVAGAALFERHHPWFLVPLYLGVMLFSVSWQFFLGVISDEQFAQISRAGRPIGAILWWVGVIVSLSVSVAVGIAAMVILPELSWPREATGFIVASTLLGLGILFAGGIGLAVATSGSIPLTSHPERRKTSRAQLGYLPLWLALLILLALTVYVLNAVQSIFPVAVVAAFVAPIGLSLGSRRQRVNEMTRTMVTALEDTYVAARSAQRRRFVAWDMAALGPALVRLQSALADDYLVSAFRNDASSRAEPEIQVIVAHLAHHFTGVPLTALAEARKDKVAQYLHSYSDQRIARLCVAFTGELRKQLIR
jgi:hypothetical protein